MTIIIFIIFLTIMNFKMTGWKILHSVCFLTSVLLIIQIHKLTPVFINNYFNPVYLCGFTPLFISLGFNIQHDSEKLSEQKNIKESV